MLRDLWNLPILMLTGRFANAAIWTDAKGDRGWYKCGVSVHSVFMAVLALLWCGAIFVSMAGWGLLTAHAYHSRRPGGIRLELGWGEAAAVGLACMCLVGGVLNLLHLILPAILVLLTVAGLTAFGWTLMKERRQSARGRVWSLSQRLGAAAVLMAIGLYLISFVRPAGYGQCEAARAAGSTAYCNLTAFTSLADDTQAYMVFPMEMLETHYFAADPYSQRRIMGSLGFNYYLQDFFLTLGRFRNVALVDGELGVLLLGTLAWGLGERPGLSRGQPLTFVALAAMSREIYWNLSFVWLPCALFVAMAVTSSGETARNRKEAMLVGAVGGASIALKNNYAVYVVLFVVLFQGLEAWQERSWEARLRAWVSGVGLGALGALAVMALWMVDQHHTSGTYFFPVLGHGDEYTTYHLLPTRSIASARQLAKCGLFAVPTLLLGVMEALWARASRFQRVCVAAALASSAASLITGLATGADMLRRYCYPQLMAPVLLVFPLVCVAINARPRGRRAGRSLAAAAAAMVVLGWAADLWNSNTGLDTPRAAWTAHTEDFVAGLRDQPLNSAGVEAEYRAVQKALPAGAAAIESVTYPYLFDFRRNRIDEASFPGMASPPPAPGWPIFGSGEELGAWLQAHGVRYLIYAYVDQALDTKNELRNAADERKPAVVRATGMALVLAHAQYDELARTRRRVYDDGSIYILDLFARRGS